MDLRRLTAFLAIVDTGTFAAAADALGTGQSTISSGIRVLERDLGVALFDRSARTAVLTAAGHALVPRARLLLREADLTRALVRDAGRDVAGTLRLGVISPTDPVPLPALLREFTRRHPAVSLRILSDAVGTVGLLDRLHRCELDLAVVAGPFPAPPPAEPVTAPIASGNLVCITAPHDPLTAHPQVAPAELADRPWVEAPVGQANRTTTDAAFAAARLSRTVVVEVGAPADVPGYVAAGIGIAFVPDFLVRGRSDVRVLATPALRLRWNVLLARLPERDTPLITAAWSILTETR